MIGRWRLIMPQIEIDFDVWKQLTAMRLNERHSYNDVLRSLLALESIQEPESQLAQFADAMPSGFIAPTNGFYSRGVFLPDGTTLRAIYRGKPHYAKIENGQWVDENGKSQSSPSAAASAITGNNVNGLRFWWAQLPDQVAWVQLDGFKKQ